MGRYRSSDIAVPNPIFQAFVQRLCEADSYVAWQVRQAVAHRANYRGLFESRAIQPLVECLSPQQVPAGCLRHLHVETKILIKTLESSRHDLRVDPPHIPDPQPASISKRALTLEEEQALTQRIRSKFIGQKKFCPPQFVQMMAL
jgi:hypothetical protein